MPVPCVSCNQTTSSPLKFLLDCVQCKLSWHHRCHKPPVSDSELIGIIKLYNSENKVNSDAKLVWKCGACVKGKAKVIEPKENPGISKRLSSEKSVASRPQQATSSEFARILQKDIIIIDDDDDDIVVLDQPKVHALNRHAKPVTSKEPITYPIALVLGSERKSTPPSQLPVTSTHAPEERKQAATQSHTKSSSNAFSVAPLEVQQGAPSPPPIPPTTFSPMTKTIHRGKKTPSAKQYDAGIRIIDDPFVDNANMSAPMIPMPPLIQRQTSSSSSTLVSGFIDLSMSSDEESAMHDDGRDKGRYDDDDELEYLTPPQPPAALLPPQEPPHGLAREQTTTPLGNTSVPVTAQLLLLPAWINAQRTELGVRPDLWQRAAQRGQILTTTTNQPASKPTASSGVSVEGQPNVAPVSSRRKSFKARCLIPKDGKESEKTIAQTPFFFDANLWLKQKMIALPN